MGGDVGKDFIVGDWIYDLETYPNIFTFCAVYASGKGIRVFEVSDRRNDTQAILDFLRNLAKNKHRMVGFNNRQFDYSIVHYIIEQSRNANIVGQPLVLDYKAIYSKAMEVIESNKGDGFGISVKEEDVVIKQVDLFKIHHFDNKARSTSLKMLEFNMRSDNIEDLPFPVGTMLDDNQKDTLIEYNKHDVLQTLAFYRHSLEAIRFREGLSAKFGFDCTNFNDTKIGKEYFINMLEKQMPGVCYTKHKFGRKVRQTKRPVIRLKDVIFPYVKFDRPEFNAILQWFKAQSITETKGVFADIPDHLLFDVAKYAVLTKKRKKIKEEITPELVEKLKQEHPLCYIEEIALKSGKDAKSYWKCWNEADSLNVVIDGFRFDFGTGGIHGSVESCTVRDSDTHTIIDADVSSLYPNIAIANRAYPEHLTERFCNIYEDVYNQRKSFPKGSPENAVMKLALNGVYGDSNNEFSPFYDPQYTMAITINGQLSLCMLVEKLLTIPDVFIIQVNTDGVTVKIPREHTEMYYSICKEWESIVNLQLEFAEYSAMYIRDVNNYIAVYTNGKLKNKGAYEYKDLGWHKNHSALVIPMAAEHQLLGRGSAEDFIRSHDNKWDFMLRTKVPRSSRLVLVDELGNEEQLQNICRYYPSTVGGKLIKIMPPLPGKEEAGERRLSIDAEWNVVPCNDISKFAWDINYNYYITEAMKLVTPLIGETH